MIGSWVEAPAGRHRGRMQWSAARIAAIALTPHGSWSLLLCWLDGTFSSEDPGSVRAINAEERARYERNYRARERRAERRLRRTR
jgi:hypothetical protein